jgi:hypothetical protein
MEKNYMQAKTRKGGCTGQTRKAYTILAAKDKRDVKMSTTTKMYKFETFNSEIS